MTVVINRSPMRDPESKARAIEVGRKLREARKRVPLSQADLGERVGVAQSVVSDWERGELESWRDYIEPLARALGVTPGFFSGATTIAGALSFANEIEVVGEVQGGTFKVAIEYSPEERHFLPAIPVPAYERVARRYLKVVGDSVNELYPDGTYVMVVSTADTDARPGDRVVVYARKGELSEATIKEVRVEADGRIALWPRSTHPDHKTPIYLTDEDQDGPEIAYVVVGSYRPENRPPAPLQIPRGPRRR
jgi:transcriptional regulator with XRE-family HTH domain